jgi:hypothetical protein
MKRFIPTAAGTEDDFGRTGHDADPTAYSHLPNLDFRISFFAPK